MKASFTDIKRQIMDIAEKSGGGCEQRLNLSIQGNRKIL